MRNIVTAEICGLITLIFILFGIRARSVVRNKQTNSFVLLLFFLFFGIVFDISSYLSESFVDYSLSFRLVNTLAFMSGSLIMLPYLYYVHSIVSRYLNLSIWHFHIPALVALFNSAYLFYLGMTWQLFTFVDGAYVSNGYPIISIVCVFFNLIYFLIHSIVFGMLSREKNIFILATYSIFPMLTEIYCVMNKEADSYTLVACVYSILLIYIVLQHEFTANIISERKIALRLAHIDSLTGIGNRFVGTDAVNERLEKKKPFTLILFDVDKFKFINDTFGHPTGDLVLQSIAGVLRNSFPKAVPVRLGGDEFMVIVDGSKDSNEVEEMMDKFFANITSMHVKGIGHAYKFAVSAGVVAFDTTSNDRFDDLYHISDQRLYESKQFEGCHYTFEELD